MTKKGQLSIDLLFSIIIFLVVLGVLMGYVNNFETVSKDYSSNMSGFTTYITTYDLVKSLDYMSGFNLRIYFNDINFDYDSANKTIILDSNNNYNISVTKMLCVVPDKVCGK